MLGRVLAILVAVAGAAQSAAAQDKPPPKTDETGSNTEAELAKKLQNPIASLITVPIQNNWDFGIGSASATRYLVNLQPVIPVSLSPDWNVITRTIMPFSSMDAAVSGGRGTGGIGDTLQSFFFSPKQPVGGWIMGAGPVILYPSASDSALGAEKWGMGPTGVVLRQEHGWTYGMLANHVESFASAGHDRRDDVSSTYLQPFLTYTTATHTSFSLNTESTYDWRHSQWTVPINAMISQLTKIGAQPVQFQFGGRYYAEGPPGTPDWGLRFTVTFLFPE